MKLNESLGWTIEIADSGRLALRELHRDVAARILEFLYERVAKYPEPQLLAKKLEGSEGICRFKVGDYRILAQFERERLVILVIDADHRSAVYKR